MKPIQVPTIPVNAAVNMVTRFRDQFASQVPEANIPRAILIPIDDLMAIVEKFSTVNENGDIVNELQGVRAYFAVKLSDKALPNDVTALIVPVDKDGNDIINKNDTLTDDDNDSDIYDFTKPCPDQCDPKSPLFINP